LRRAFLAGIRLYRRIGPRFLDRRCLYRETCSVYVERALNERGLQAALAALLARIRGCRPGYRLEVTSGQLGLRLRDGTFMPAEEVAEYVLMAPRRGCPGTGMK
jgi:putative component of membrane protein insertase Oxa1/YidC/SpoIIIJ protein YidD